MTEKFLNNRFLTLFIIPISLGSLTVFTFQPFNIFVINFLILPIFFYLIIYIKKKSQSIFRKKPFRKNLFIFGTSFGFGYYLSGIHWITNSLTFDDTFKILIPFGLIFIPLFLSLFFSLILVFLRAKIFTGFPWNLWAYSLSWSPEIIQILNPIGLYALNLILITIFLIPSVLFFKINLLKKIFSLLTIPLIILCLYVYGSYSINQNKKFLNNYNKKFNVKVISPNFILKYGLSDIEVQSRLQKLIKYSEPKEKIKTLYVWPEGVFSGYNFNEISGLKKIFFENFENNHFILFGINRFDEKKGGTYNSLVIVNSKMEILHEYKKQKLVPFGEFLPFEKVLKKIGLKKITEGHGSFLKGVEQKNIIFDDLNILPLICYEIIFTKLIQSNNQNTNLIVNISEDGWFGNSIGPSQHFAKAIFRAIENNSFLVRSTNKGVSAIIDNKGLIVKKLNNLEAGNIELQVPLIKSKDKNKNDLIFYLLLITHIFIFKFYKKNNG